MTEFTEEESNQSFDFVEKIKAFHREVDGSFYDKMALTFLGLGYYFDIIIKTKNKNKPGTYKVQVKDDVRKAMVILANELSKQPELLAELFHDLSLDMKEGKEQRSFTRPHPYGYLINLLTKEARQ